MFLIFDTETTGLPKNWKAPLTDYDNWPRMVQIAWQIHDIKGELVDVKNFIIKPENYDIPFNAQKIHGISTERANKQGVDLSFVLEEFLNDVKNSKYIIGHNISFDNNIVGCELLRKGYSNILSNHSCLDTKDLSTDYCKIPGGRGGRYKWPSLTELHFKLFDEDFAEAHNASADVEATARCFLELIRIEVIPKNLVSMSDDDFEAFQKNNNDKIQLIGLNISPYDPLDKLEINEDKVLDLKNQIDNVSNNNDLLNNNIKFSFAHLHVHSQYSILQATSSISDLVDKAIEYNMPAISLTDHANMFGAFKFLNYVKNHPNNLEVNKIKPILGCELNVCKNHLEKSIKDHGSQVPFLCKNKTGFYNLSKLSSIGYINGFYYVPRVDKELIKKHSNEGDLVLDTFLGAGTTALACKNLNRRFKGCEISKEYYDKLLNVLEVV